MHVKIQGGGDGKYSNQGSCASLVNYLEHEDLQREKEGREVEPFFSHTDNASASTIIKAIDYNKQKLSKTDSKFFMITFSPSKEELKHLGFTENEQSEKIKDFVRTGVMQQYAENFNKGLNASDLMYFAKIHHDRKKSKDDNMHVHILVSRKTLDGRIKISPQTNHRNTNGGAVRGGFVRTDFYTNVENSFDNKFLYTRKREEEFDFKKQCKVAKPAELKVLMEESHKSNDQQQKNHDIFIQETKDKGFSNSEIDLLMKGKKIETDDSIFSLNLNTDKNFELQSDIKYGQDAKLFQGVSSANGDDPDDLNRKRKRSGNRR
ncbi:MAG: DUF5712 family protein [Flavobacterium sp.]